MMLVYEYVDNGNLEHWPHGDVGLVITGRSPVDYSKPLGEVRNHHLHTQQLILLFIVFLFISSIITSIVRSIY